MDGNYDDRAILTDQSSSINSYVIIKITLHRRYKQHYIKSLQSYYNAPRLMYMFPTDVPFDRDFITSN